MLRPYNIITLYSDEHSEGECNLFEYICTIYTSSEQDWVNIPMAVDTIGSLFRFLFCILVIWLQT